MASTNGDTRKAVIVVTGGASGIGLAMTNHFASQGNKVAVLDVNAEAGNEAVSQVSAEHPSATIVFKKCDVSSWQEQAQVFKEVHEEFGRIDVVMANAGISESGASALASIEVDAPVQPNLKVMDVDLYGVIYCELADGVFLR